LFVSLSFDKDASLFLKNGNAALSEEVLHPGKKFHTQVKVSYPGKKCRAKVENFYIQVTKFIAR
jgi:hypothetical protein